MVVKTATVGWLWLPLSDYITSFSFQHHFLRQYNIAWTKFKIKNNIVWIKKWLQPPKPVNDHNIRLNMDYSMLIFLALHIGIKLHL